jgi:hypothetical protein
VHYSVIVASQSEANTLAARISEQTSGSGEIFTSKLKTKMSSNPDLAPLESEIKADTSAQPAVAVMLDGEDGRSSKDIEVSATRSTDIGFIIGGVLAALFLAGAGVAGLIYYRNRKTQQQERGLAEVQGSVELGVTTFANSGVNSGRQRRMSSPDVMGKNLNWKPNPGLSDHGEQDPPGVPARKQKSRSFHAHIEPNTGETYFSPVDGGDSVWELPPGAEIE